MEMMSACEEGDSEKVLGLIGSFNKTFKDDSGRTPLHAAAEKGHDDVLRILLGNGLSIDVQDNEGKTPLMVAAENGQESSISLLTSCKANTSKQTYKDGYTALHLAAHKDLPNSCKALLTGGAEANQPDKLGKTALHYAGEALNFLCVLALLSGSASPYAKDKQGNPALEPDGLMMKLVMALVQGRKGEEEEEKPKDCYQVYCPPKPEVTGVYELVHEDHYKQLGGPFTLCRNPQDNLWCVNNGDHFVVTSFDQQDTPMAVDCWKVKDGKRFKRCEAMKVFRPAVHTGITCDGEGCKMKPIVGPRFKCTGRENFDLCSGCERSKTQPYPMVKIFALAQHPKQFAYTCSAAADITTIPTELLDGQEEHTGVTCSACQMSPIVGARYMCAVRPDYNLCSACEASTADKDGAHPHAMIKIYDPKHAPAKVLFSLDEPPKKSEGSEKKNSNDRQRSGSGGLPSPPRPSAARAPQPPLPPPVPATPAKPVLRITCADLPELDGLYEQEYDEEYQMTNGGVNRLVKHPVDNVWCVSNGNFFILTAEDVAADPTQVKAWKVRVKNRLVSATAITVELVK